jgi:DNA-directed RNA polymerase alpha subunit
VLSPEEAIRQAATILVDQLVVFAALESSQIRANESSTTGNQNIHEYLVILAI